MATLLIKVEPKNAVVSADRRGAILAVKFQRLLREASETEPAETAPTERQLPMSEKLTATFGLEGYAAGTSVGLVILDTQGIQVADLGDAKPEENGKDTFKLSVVMSDERLKRIEKALTVRAPEQTTVFAEMGEFRAVGPIELPYREMLLVVAPVKRSSIPATMLKKYFGEGDSRSSAALDVPPDRFLSDLKADVLKSVSVTLQGLFEFRMPVRDSDDCWLWTLAGPVTFGGIVAEPQKAARFRRVIWLPMEEKRATETGEETGAPTAAMPSSPALPVDPSEQEILHNPELFADDPGTHCKPFSSPNRIVGEKSFHTVLRVTQPEISADAAAPKPPRPKDLAGLFKLDATDLVMAAAKPRTEDGAPEQPAGATRRNLARSVLGNLANVRRAMTGKAPTLGGRPVLSPEAELVVAERTEVLRKSVGRKVLNSASELDWDDITPIQASSLAYGHILEHRVRWRSNGYSLGDVLYSLALAPRQTKRILTVHSEVRDRASRVETTTASERVSQSTTKDYSYSDAVQAGLSEWAKGGSSSSTTGAAGGIGLAIGPVVLGGGASHGQAQSESWQEGGRKVSATEEQSLRDAIRQYGDSLRKLESVVIQEQTQEETTQAISEVVRNPNYCHALTIIYHQILRHLRIDTETVGARECVFVPLSISPFTWSKMIRWRDSLTEALQGSPLVWVMKHLEDVEDGFANSEIAPGPRADQPIRYLSGSISLQMAVERPGGSDETFDPAKWATLAAFVGRPVRQVYERLKQQQTQMDQIFQAEFAPQIASKWVDKLLIKVGGVPLSNVDMTLATRYGFNSTVRVDFTCIPDRRITRRDLESFSVEAPATSALTPGSVVNVRQATIHYYTADFDRKRTTDSLAHDLISIADGTAQAGANLFLPIDDWEKVDQQGFIRTTALKLREYLNERLEQFHKDIWRRFDPDKVYMLLDTIYALSEADGRSVASVVERNPIAILGNSLVYRVASGAHLGIDGHKTSADLNAYYRDAASRSEPIRISLPTAGVYAQAILDDCPACEEHFGSTEWVLSDKEPELADLDPSMLASRRAAGPNLTPSEMPASIISLQNAPSAPAPSGFGGVFDALTKADAFRDMAGLEGTQANARAAMESAAELATTFGTQAAEIRKAEIAARVAKEKLAVVQKAKDTGAGTPGTHQEVEDSVLKEMANNGPEKREAPLDPQQIKDVAKASEETNSNIEVDQRRKKIAVTRRAGAGQKLTFIVSVDLLGDMATDMVTGRMYVVHAEGESSFGPFNLQSGGMRATLNNVSERSGSLKVDLSWYVETHDPAPIPGATRQPIAAGGTHHVEGECTFTPPPAGSNVLVFEAKPAITRVQKEASNAVEAHESAQKEGNGKLVLSMKIIELGGGGSGTSGSGSSSTTTTKDIWEITMIEPRLELKQKPSG